MPQIGNLASKKADNTTAVTLTAIQPNGGDATPAVYVDMQSGDAAAFRSTHSYSFKKSGDGRSKRVHFKSAVPQVITENGVSRVVNTALFETSGVIPLSMPEQAVKDAYAIHISAQTAAAGTLVQAMPTGTALI